MMLLYIYKNTNVKSIKNTKEKDNCFKFIL